MNQDYIDSSNMNHPRRFYLVGGNGSDQSAYTKNETIEKEQPAQRIDKHSLNMFTGLDTYEGGDSVDWQEKYFDKVDREVTDIKSEMRNAEARITASIEIKLEQFRNEMRHLDNQRNQDMVEIRNQLAENTRHVQNISQATVIGVSSMVIAVVLGIAGIWWTVSTSQSAILEILQKIPK